MNRRLACWKWLLIAATVLPAGERTSRDACGADSLTPPANLRIHAGSVQADSGTLLEADAAAWKAAKATRVLLNRSPRIYQTEPLRDQPIPALEVRALRAAGKVFFRLQWTDATKNAPVAPDKRQGTGGDPAQLYKRPTGETNAFPDAAAVLVPESWTGPAFPSLVMGDKSSPVYLYYWNASRGAERLKSSGRATPETTGAKLPHRARHADGKWALTLEMAEPPAGCPVAFAVWDGQAGDRDGLKFFSIWYVLLQE